ncbi:XRE family transcriptional regulator [Pseudomethylobacillus aquaticus]|uniref:XRE family transcriptional regulator n=1 Tax=Pseudomethylobacillus aquaticus TaxID=2676064 RepID=A0A3N0UYT7_9PROT|nr:XRE family transcriptional regulator [Pseudomethylobacillus aquaticus]
MSYLFEQLRNCLAANVKRRRVALGLSQEELAFNSHIDRTYISRIENSIGNVSLRIVCEIAESLNTDPSDLLKCIDEPPQ